MSEPNFSLVPHSQLFVISLSRWGPLFHPRGRLLQPQSLAQMQLLTAELLGHALLQREPQTLSHGSHSGCTVLSSNTEEFLREAIGAVWLDPAVKQLKQLPSWRLFSYDFHEANNRNAFTFVHLTLPRRKQGCRWVSARCRSPHSLRKSHFLPCGKFSHRPAEVHSSPWGK